MDKIKKILLATDFRETMDQEIDTAAYLVSRLRAQLIPLHVTKKNSTENVEKKRSAAEESDVSASTLARFAQRLQEKGLPDSSLITKYGEPATCILSAADDYDADIIIMGAGKKGIVERILGCTVEKVIRTARQPVWVVHPNGHAVGLQSVLCAVDCSTDSANTLNTALFFCRELDADLCILHVNPHQRYYPAQTELSAPIPNWGIDSMPDIHVQSEDMHKIDYPEYARFREHLEKFVVTGINFSHMIKHGDPVNAISRAVNETGCDLLIMGASDVKKKTVFLFWGTMDKVIRKVTCPVMTIRHDK